jgi:hypothetical protein
MRAESFLPWGHYCTLGAIKATVWIIFPQTNPAIHIECTNSTKLNQITWLPMTSALCWHHYKTVNEYSNQRIQFGTCSQLYDCNTSNPLRILIKGQYNLVCASALTFVQNMCMYIHMYKPKTFLRFLWIIYVLQYSLSFRRTLPVQRHGSRNIHHDKRDHR